MYPVFYTLTGVILLEFCQDILLQSPLAIIRHCLHDPVFSHFGAIQVCDWQTDGQTDTGPHHLPC